MIPRIAKRGHSFLGAGLYYLHDKQARTSERVGWTETLNLPTNDPEKAMRCMAWTALHADELKRESGGSTTGRSQSAGSVYAYSLAWHGEQQPDKAQMLAAAHATLQRLGLSGHEAVIVAHDDTDHKHIHIIANLVHPETGKVASIRQDQRTLSAWAQEYERAEGKIYCIEREENAERRSQGELTKHQDERLQAGPDFTAMYHQADSGKAFVAALEEAGYVLANGDKGRLVIVDDAGRIQALTRQVDGARKKDIEAKLADMDLNVLPAANDVAARRKEQAAPVPIVPELEAPASKQPEAAPPVAAPQAEQEATATQGQSASIEERTEEHRDRAARYEPAAKKQAAPAPVKLKAQVTNYLERLRQWIKSKPRAYWERWQRSAGRSRPPRGKETPRPVPPREKDPYYNKEHYR